MSRKRSASQAFGCASFGQLSVGRKSRRKAAVKEIDLTLSVSAEYVATAASFGSLQTTTKPKRSSKRLKRTRKQPKRTPAVAQTSAEQCIIEAHTQVVAELDSHLNGITDLSNLTLEFVAFGGRHPFAHAFNECKQTNSAHATELRSANRRHKTAKSSLEAIHKTQRRALRDRHTAERKDDVLANLMQRVLNENKERCRHCGRFRQGRGCFSKLCVARRKEEQRRFYERRRIVEERKKKFDAWWRSRSSLSPTRFNLSYRFEI